MLDDMDLGLPADMAPLHLSMHEDTPPGLPAGVTAVTALTRVMDMLNDLRGDITNA